MYEYPVLCLDAEITTGHINHIVESVRWQSNVKLVRFMSGIKASMMDVKFLAMTLVVTSISVNKWLKCLTCGTDCEKSQLEMCGPNCTGGWIFCRIFMMSWTCTAFVSSWYFACWRSNKKDKYDGAFSVTSSIWPIKTHSLSSLSQGVTGASCHAHKRAVF